MKYKSREISVLNLEKMFSKTSGDVITVEEACISYDRNLEEKEKNSNWLSNLLTHLKYYGLVKTLYSLKNSRRVLDRIQLTAEGMRALGREVEYSPRGEVKVNSTSADSPTFPDVMKIIAKLREQNPDYQITFDIKLKE